MSHTSCTRLSRGGRLVGGLFLLLILATAPAQSTPTGTVEATVDGASRTLSTMLFEGESSGLPTATWQDVMGMFAMVSIRAHPEEHYTTEGTLSIEFTDLTGVPSDCPCTYADATVMLWTTSAILEDVYMDDAAEVVVTSLEPLGDDVYALRGTFAADPVLYPSIPSGPDPDERITIEGTFEIDRLPRAPGVE